MLLLLVLVLAALHQFNLPPSRLPAFPCAQFTELEEREKAAKEKLAAKALAAEVKRKEAALEYSRRLEKVHTSLAGRTTHCRLQPWPHHPFHPTLRFTTGSLGSVWHCVCVFVCVSRFGRRRWPTPTQPRRDTTSWR